VLIARASKRRGIREREGCDPDVTNRIDVILSLSLSDDDDDGRTKTVQKVVRAAQITLSSSHSVSFKTYLLLRVKFLCEKECVC
jgi:hypothetical protein